MIVHIAKATTGQMRAYSTLQKAVEESPTFFYGEGNYKVDVWCKVLSNHSTTFYEINYFLNNDYFDRGQCLIYVYPLLVDSDSIDAFAILPDDHTYLKGLFTYAPNEED